MLILSGTNTHTNNDRPIDRSIYFIDQIYWYLLERDEIAVLDQRASGRVARKELNGGIHSRLMESHMTIGCG